MLQAMTDATHSYLGVAECGCIRVGIIDDRRQAGRVATVIRDCVKRGYRVEHVPNEEVRTRPWICPTHTRTADKTGVRVQARQLELVGCDD